ncbi:cytochrome C biogenesis protein CcsB [Haemophilus quentini]|uniref:Cytochrome C biogenesis protein CcsB n=1 Tax=Haemophilus quentini TaxID=123834 RepID=A0ABX3BQD7_9PAST|nr:c-type cytochrome [Haemophilus quentini]EGT80860.1 putative cytochrome c [Haemophilus haemolyticus M21639]OEY75732.1 cytochrome C biogenesis protein CcsB [Haemophilus quentini]OEY77631.1 cytochrome C biogenesis protein CcsB [Haemophilus quentini]ORC38841.1 cytochrome C biogenesis protein CcsB [Haemophilus quentini]
MKRIYKTTLFSLSLLTASQLVLADMNAKQAENFYKRTCATCHGKSAEKSALGQSRIINTLNSEEIYTALSDRKSGKIQGAGNMVKSRLSEKDIKMLSEFVPILKK